MFGSGSSQIATLVERQTRYVMLVKVAGKDTQTVVNAIVRHARKQNTNGLLRQYLPKGLDISGYSQASLDAIARKLNKRPRKTLGYSTPAEMFDQCVALTG